MSNQLRNHIENRMPMLAGGWVGRNSSYDDDLAAALAMTARTSRYWDAQWHDTLVEFKKGRSIWLDLVRYSEVLLGTSDEARRETQTMFFVPDSARSQIDRVACVATSKLLDHLGLTPSEARSLVDLRARLPRSLNAQASLTVNDVIRIADFVVDR